jgi:uncharacterized membrane protein YqjE
MFATVDRLQELSGRLTSEVRNLLRLELQLAQAEMADKAKSVARIVAYAAVAGVFAFFAVFGLLIAAIWGLGEAMPIWASALIVTFVFLLMAALVAYLAVRRARKIGPPYPGDAAANLQALPDEIREAVK